MVRYHLLGAGPADILACRRWTQSETVDAGTWTGDHCARLDRRRRVSKDEYIVKSRASPLNVRLAAWPAAAPQDTGLCRGTGSPVLAGWTNQQLGERTEERWHTQVVKQSSSFL